MSISRSNLLFLIRILGFIQVIEWVAAGDASSSVSTDNFFDDDKVYCDDHTDGKCMQYFTRRGARADNAYMIDADKRKFENSFVNPVEYIEFFDHCINKELAKNCSSSFHDMKTTHMNPKHFTHHVARNSHAQVRALSKSLDPSYVKCIEKALKCANNELDIVSEEDRKSEQEGLEILGIVVGSLIAAVISAIGAVCLGKKTRECYESSQEERNKLLSSPGLKKFGTFFSEKQNPNPINAVKVPAKNNDEVSGPLLEDVRQSAPEPV